MSHSAEVKKFLYNVCLGYTVEEHTVSQVRVRRSRDAIVQSALSGERPTLDSNLALSTGDRSNVSADEAVRDVASVVGAAAKEGWHGGTRNEMVEKIRQAAQKKQKFKQVDIAEKELRSKRMARAVKAAGKMTNHEKLKGAAPRFDDEEVAAFEAGIKNEMAEYKGVAERFNQLVLKLDTASNLKDFKNSPKGKLLKVMITEALPFVLGPAGVMGGQAVIETAIHGLELYIGIATMQVGKSAEALDAANSKLDGAMRDLTAILAQKLEASVIAMIETPSTRGESGRLQGEIKLKKMRYWLQVLRRSQVSRG